MSIYVQHVCMSACISLYIFVYCKSEETPHQRTNEQSDN